MVNFGRGLNLNLMLFVPLVVKSSGATSVSAPKIELNLTFLDWVDPILHYFGLVLV